MKRVLLVCGIVLLAGCADKAENTKVEPTTAAETTEKNEEAEIVENPNTEEAAIEEVAPYSETEAEEFRLKLVEVEALAVEYLYNTKGDIYVCGKICDDQPLTDVQLSMDISRNGLEKAAQQMAGIVPEIEDYANSGTQGVNKEEMHRVANQFETSAEDIELLLAKENWSSWAEPGELIDQIIAELEEVSWLYKPYSPAIDTDEAEQLEAESAISGAIVEIMYARDELQKSYDFQLAHLREEPIKLDGGGYGKASASYLDYTDQYIDLMIESADRAMQYEMDERLKNEFESLKTSAELIREGVNEYNSYIETYSDPYDFDSLMNDWRSINKAIDKIDTGLYFKSYEMEIYQDFVGY